MRKFTFLFSLLLSAKLFAQTDSAKLAQVYVRNPFVIQGKLKDDAFTSDEFIIGPEFNVCGDGEFFIGVGGHLDWISSHPKGDDDPWQYCDHLFIAKWNWYVDHPYHYGIDLEYDMFRSREGRSPIKLIGGVKVSHLYNYSDHEIVWTPLLGFTAMGKFDLKFGFVLPVVAREDDFYNTYLWQFNFVYRPCLKFHPDIRR